MTGRSVGLCRLVGQTACEWMEGRGSSNGGAMRVVVGITGASGVIYGIRLLAALRKAGVGTDLVLSEWAPTVVKQETGMSVEMLSQLAERTFDVADLAAPIASGSSLAFKMVVVPCTMKTLAGIANGFSANLIMRAADVALKEKRTLILVPRETPLHAIHLNNMLTLARLGVTILPPIPAFYTHPSTIEDLVDHTVYRILSHLEIDCDPCEGHMYAGQ